MGLLKIFKEEPVLIQGLLQSAIALAVAFNVNLSEKQIGALLAFLAALFAFAARTAVTPTANPKLSQLTPLVPQPAPNPQTLPAPQTSLVPRAT